MKCAFITASGKVPGAAGCCSGSNCMFRISCIADADIDDDCDSACQADALTLKWYRTSPTNWSLRILP